MKAIWRLVLVLALFLPSGVPFSQAVQPNEGKKPSELPLAPIDINQASQEDFTKLPGVGPELARRIVAFRTKHGPFRRVEDLLAVRGIGPKKWRKLRPYLRVGEQKKGVGSRESGVGSRESGVGSRESGVGSRESGVGSRESGVLKKLR